jgi:hypothetical protein
MGRARTSCAALLVRSVVRTLGRIGCIRYVHRGARRPLRSSSRQARNRVPGAARCTARHELRVQHGSKRLPPSPLPHTCPEPWSSGCMSRQRSSLTSHRRTLRPCRLPPPPISPALAGCIPPTVLSNPHSWAPRGSEPGCAVAARLPWHGERELGASACLPEHSGHPGTAGVATTPAEVEAGLTDPVLAHPG